MLIRRPALDVFDAFVNPEITRRFWFSSGSGPLEPGKVVSWHWDVYGISADVRVLVVEPGARIVIEWPTPVEWEFTPQSADTTMVNITAFGFTGTDAERASSAIDSMGGFCYVLAGCKAFLEHGIELNLIADHAADAIIYE
ncbi:activator of HSP90 ATPase [Lysobacter helvus]|uniref:Activator of HSP90 ATPase n=3 Tax=Lysobacterales TaxID=135614 RepID=A0ABM7Q6Y3_9GAMM|nr:activator of HSP90 ATPase [Lysobacter caseinilyticus]BCT96309.1 activator of HSP90 ATPase [Lysobacter helvus]